MPEEVLSTRPEFKSTKSYYNLPCAHLQHFDVDETNEPYSGPCAKWHGYDRSVHFEFSGDIDENGWLVGFGDLDPVKEFLDFYFDHTALISANDPRLEIAKEMDEKKMVDLRVLPYGVSMEMSALFIWEQVNPHIYYITKGRAYVSKVECREHEKNSAVFSVTKELAYQQAKEVKSGDWLRKDKMWDKISPRNAIENLNKMIKSLSA